MYHEKIRIKNTNVDTWWQTETGTYDHSTAWCNSNQTRTATLPFFGIDAAILDETGKECTNEGGRLVIRSHGHQC